MFLGAPGFRAPRFALPDELFFRCWPMCFALLALGVLCLLADLGRPDRVLALVVHPAPSVLLVGAWVLFAALLLAAAFSVSALFDGARLPRLALRALAALGAVAGAATMAYTGVLLQGMASVLAWQTPFVPALFVLSSLSCGIACVLFMAAFVETRYPFLKPVARLTAVDSVLVAAEAACLAGYLLWLSGGSGTAAAAQALAMGDLAGAFWGGLAACGLAIPFAMEHFLTHGNYRTQLLWIAVLLLVGGFVLRYCVVGVSSYDVTQDAQMAYGLMLSAEGGISA